MGNKEEDNFSLVGSIRCWACQYEVYGFRESSLLLTSNMNLLNYHVRTLLLGKPVFFWHLPFIEPLEKANSAQLFICQKCSFLAFSELWKPNSCSLSCKTSVLSFASVSRLLPATQKNLHDLSCLWSLSENSMVAKTFYFIM